MHKRGRERSGISRSRKKTKQTMRARCCLTAGATLARLADYGTIKKTPDGDEWSAARRARGALAADGRRTGAGPVRRHFCTPASRKQ
ncbi:hypothetical protein EVAR_19046_1 [Eumeta japonica]|uniref:Uncharacterized protein n=1 Tax=Eumeta variegata TaxID=151549 RepID=A0A4C1VAJ6_EUMVA|nr:hypothetical protein EVAR_19046_1 [Eumeta japonica]